MRYILSIELSRTKSCSIHCMIFYIRRQKGNDHFDLFKMARLYMISILYTQKMQNNSIDDCRLGFTAQYWSEDRLLVQDYSLTLQSTLEPHSGTQRVNITKYYCNIHFKPKYNTISYYSLFLMLEFRKLFFLQHDKQHKPLYVIVVLTFAYVGLVTFS